MMARGKYMFSCLHKGEHSTFLVYAPRTANVDDLKGLIRQKRIKTPVFRDFDPTVTNLSISKVCPELLLCLIAQLNHLSCRLK
jgi:hypothetical protein